MITAADHPPGSSPRRGQRILVSGATSTLGRMLCHELYHDDRVAAIMAVSPEEQPYYFNDFDPYRFVYQQVNIHKPRQLQNLCLSARFRELAIDTVFHLAFLRQSGKPERDPFKLHVEGTKQFLDRCLQTESVRRFIFLSGSLVYKLRPWNDVFIDEDADLNFDPNADPWIKARVDADMLCRTHMDHERMDIVVVRPGPVIGRNIRSHLNDLLSSYMVLRVAGYDPMIRPIHVRDLVRALKATVFAESHGVFNIAGKDMAPLSEFLRLSGRFSVSMPNLLLRHANRLQRLLRLTNLDLSSAPEWLRYACILDTQRAENVLGFQPEHHVTFM